MAIDRSGQFQLTDFLQVVAALANDHPLEKRHRDHNLTGNWSHYRECHIQPDWLLIYRLEPGKLTLVRTGSHAELFE